MRLAYRIATMEPLFRVEADVERFRDFVAYQRSAIKTCPTLCLDNVSEYFEARDKCWHNNDIPNWSPPFNEFFCEWSSESGEVDSGVFVKADSADFYSLSYAKEFFARSESKSQEEIGELLGRSKWIVAFFNWFSRKSRPVCSSPVVAGFSTLMLVDKFGTSLHSSTMMQPDSHEEDQIFRAQWDCKVVGLGVSFMHCKNVKTVERPEPRKESWHRQEQCPVFKFKTLNIDPMKQVLRTEGQSESTGLKKALHICRGHFAHYSEDKPLFGKYVGDFFVPAHVRGSSDRGVVAKDYNVKI